MSVSNQKQVGGTHYKRGGEEHWDRVNRLGLNYFQAAATKYIERCYLKDNVVQDLNKAIHYLEKLIEIETGNAGAELVEMCGYVDQDR